MESSPQLAGRRRGSTFGFVLILVSAFFLYFAKDISRSGLTAANDPGPRALPVAICLLLLAGGLVDAGLEWWRRRCPVGDATVFEEERGDEAQRRGGLVNVLFLVVFLVGFLVLVSIIGFLPSTFLFAFGMTWRLGARWWHALVFAAVLVAVIYVLFVRMFEVPLPGGWFV